ncbi:MAG: hypothetical protein MZV63_55170 [Marinilabiliales bacterium]|nr:hypothetical protein [Marinilabiliales bacterium]
MAITMQLMFTRVMYVHCRDITREEQSGRKSLISSGWFAGLDFQYKNSCAEIMTSSSGKKPEFLELAGDANVLYLRGHQYGLMDIQFLARLSH